jgi:tRNA1Val (adenine37-N6)-methyltransferase
MSDYFDFKSFRVNQHYSTAKIGTDALLLGAWFQAADKINFLDIGTGSGVIALLAASRFPQLNIFAIEPDEFSAKDASVNFQQVKNSHSIQLLKMSLLEFLAFNDKRFDIIVSNPPYHTESVFSHNDSRSRWRSEIHLPFEEMFLGVKTLLSDHGSFNLIAPYINLKKITSHAIQNNLFLQRCCLISSFKDEKPIRFLAEFGFEYKNFIINEICIYDKLNVYSTDYNNLVGKYLI